MKAHAMPEDVTFWRWLNETTLALVTEHAVFHWSIEGDAAPVQQFARHESLAGTQIIAYRVSDDQKWCALIGIFAEEGREAGALQLFSVEKQVSQPLEGHAAAFCMFTPPGATAAASLLVRAVRHATGAKLDILDVAGTGFQNKSVDIHFPADAAADFPVAMEISHKYHVIYLITTLGFVHLYDLETGTCLYRNRVSSETIFVTAPHEATSGIIGVNRKGQVLSVAVDEAHIVQYIAQTLQNPELALRLAARGNLPGAEETFVQRFNQCFAHGQFLEAANIAATAPRGILRNPQTIARLQSAPAEPGQMSAVLQYFTILLEGGKLNRVESLELCRSVAQQNRVELLEKWLQEDRLECSEDLGDLIKAVAPKCALSVYLRGDAPAKVVQCFAEMGDCDRIVPYARTVNYTPDYPCILRMILRGSPEKAAPFAISLVKESPPLADVGGLSSVLEEAQMFEPLNTFLLEALKENKPEHAALQTDLLVRNLATAPQVADAILGNNIFSHYDRGRDTHVRAGRPLPARPRALHGPR